MRGLRDEDEAMTDPITIRMPLHLTPEMIAAVRDDPTTKCAPENWHARLGWLICVWDVLVRERMLATQPRASPEIPPASKQV